MPDIKTRAVAEKAVKTIDKSAIAAQRMKRAYAQAKEKAERITASGEESAEGYAADRVSDAESTIAHESVHQLDCQGHKGLETTKENLAKLKARFQRKRLTDPLKKQQQKEAARPPEEGKGGIRREGNTQRAADTNIRRPACISNRSTLPTRGEQGAVKATKQTGKVTKQSAKATGQTVAKKAERTVKTVQRSVRNTKTTGRAAVKISYQATRTSQRMVQTAAEPAKKAAQATVKAVRAVIAGARTLIAAIQGMNHALAVSIGLIEPVPPKLTLCLCGACADAFRGTGAFALQEAAPGQAEKEICAYCKERMGVYFDVTPKESRGQV